ncbi:MAG: radical SAM protein [Acidobacteria bacterium]|nr:radical SAM protein [Acidobacteriota bacterium]
MKVNEIYYSIQGESSHAGRPCAIVRLTGCDLRCAWCDTAYAFHEGREVTVAQVLDEISAFPSKLVLVTGGEPMLQPAVHELFERLLARGHEVCMETGGHISLRDVDLRVHKIMDLKCPSSRMSEHNHFENIRYLTRNDEVKFVVGDRGDFDWACARIREFGLPSLVGSVLISPVFGRLPYDVLAGWVLGCGLDVRLQLQLHRLVWPYAVRGV